MTSLQAVGRRARASAAYRRVFVPVDGSDAGELAVAEACLLAARGAVVSVAAVEVPLERPLGVPDEQLERDAREALARARAIGLAYGVDVRTRLVRTRSAAETIVEEAEREGADAILLHIARGRRLGATAEHVLRHARCRVLVTAS